jgi:hypothetical protein
MRDEKGVMMLYWRMPYWRRGGRLYTSRVCDSVSYPTRKRRMSLEMWSSFCRDSAVIQRLRTRAWLLAIRRMRRGRGVYQRETSNLCIDRQNPYFRDLRVRRCMFIFYLWQPGRSNTYFRHKRINITPLVEVGSGVGARGGAPNVPAVPL